MKLTKRDILRSVSAVAMATGLSFAVGSAHAAEELNFMTWCDHDDPNIIRPFEEAHDVKVNVKVYELTGAAISILEQSQPGDWDVIVVDSADVLRMGEGGWLQPPQQGRLPLRRHLRWRRNAAPSRIRRNALGRPGKVRLQHDGL